MKTQLEGTLVRFESVGVVDVQEAPEYVYFKPRDILGYQGETVDELTSRPSGDWTNGKIVVIQADVDPSGNVHVSSVKLK